MSGLESAASPGRRLLLPLAGIALLIGLEWGYAVPRAQSQASPGGITGWDLETYFLPKYAFGTRELLEGRLPLWNRFEFAGIPFLATAQPAALYPPKIAAFALLRPEWALRAFFIGHAVLMALLFAALAREQGLGRTATFAGTVFFVFNHATVRSLGHPVQIANLTWLPLIFLFVERIGRGSRARAVAGLGIAVALQATAGYPALTLCTSVLVAVYVVMRWLSGQWTAPPWRTLPLTAAGFVLGSGIAGLQLVPLAALVDVTSRVAIARHMVEHLSLPWGVWLDTVLGVPALLGFALAGRSRQSLAPLAGAAFCLLMMLGGWRLLRLLPLFSAIRIPAIWALLSPFFIAWAVALGVERSGEGWRRGPALRARWLGAGSAVSWAGAALWLSCVDPLPANGPMLAQTARLLALPAPGRDPSSLTALLPLAGAGVLLATALVRRPPHWHRRALVLGIGLLVAGQLVALPVMRSLPRFEVPKGLPRSAELLPRAELQHGRVLSLADARGGFHLLDRVENTSGREGSLPPPRATAVEQRLGIVVQLMRADWKELVQLPGLLETLDVRFVLAPRAQARAFRRLGFRPRGGGDRYHTMLERPQRLGRAWLQYSAEVVDSKEQALERVLSPSFDPRRTVILERPPAHRLPARSSLPPLPVTAHYLSPTHVEMEVDAQAPGILVLADSCFPGWQVRVDDVPATLLCANYLVRGVELSKGRHRVSFDYRPASVRVGASLSLAALGLTALLLRRRGREPYSR